MMEILIACNLVFSLAVHATYNIEGKSGCFLTILKRLKGVDHVALVINQKQTGSGNAKGRYSRAEVARLARSRSSFIESAGTVL